MKYVIARTYSAGVFAGYLDVKDGKEVTLLNARRLWRWAGAASLSELAVNGVKLPDECMFPVAVPRVVLTEVIEILDVTDVAKASIEAVPVWSAWSGSGCGDGDGYGSGDGYGDGSGYGSGGYGGSGCGSGSGDGYGDG